MLVQYGDFRGFYTKKMLVLLWVLIFIPSRSSIKIWKIILKNNCIFIIIFWDVTNNYTEMCKLNLLWPQSALLELYWNSLFKKTFSGFKSRPWSVLILGLSSMPHFVNSSLTALVPVIRVANLFIDSILFWGAIRVHSERAYKKIFCKWELISRKNLLKILSTYIHHGIVWSLFICDSSHICKLRNNFHSLQITWKNFLILIFFLENDNNSNISFG